MGRGTMYTIREVVVVVVVIGEQEKWPRSSFLLQRLLWHLHNNTSLHFLGAAVHSENGTT